MSGPTLRCRPQPGAASEGERDEGAVGILAVGLCIILLFLTVTVVAVTSVYVEQRKLQLLADQCADAASSRISGLSSAATGQGPHPTLTAGSVAQSTQEVIAGVPHHLDGVGIAQASTDGANTAQVTLTATAHPALVSIFVPDGVDIEAHSSARVVLTR